MSRALQVGRRALPWAALLALVVLAYLPVWNAGFIWDDDILLTKNDFIKRADGLRVIWFTTEFVDYFPVTSTVFWLQWRLWGENPLGYHLVNVLLHALASLVWWRVFRRLPIPGSWWVAAVFAVHPVNVESVAWISELKNTLSMLFFAVCAYAWVRTEEGGGSPSTRSSGDLGGATGWYWTAVGAFLLAMLSKTAVAALPAVLLGFAWWRRGVITRRDLVRVIPFLGIAAALAIATLWFQHHRAIGSTVVRTDDFWSRLAVAGHALWFYLGKAVMPVNLSIIYPRWEIDGSTWISFIPGVLFGLIVYLAWRMRHAWGRGVLFALVFFVAMLLPILGFINVGAMRFSLVADRWQYFALLAPLAVLASVLAALRRVLPAGGWTAASRWQLAGGALLAALAMASWRHARAYESPSTLWAATLRTNPDCSIAHNETGSELVAAGQHDRAIRHFRRAIDLLPGYEVAFYNYGVALLDVGRTEAAVRFFERAVQIEPNLVDARYNLGTTLLNTGRAAEAVAHLQHAIEREPTHARARNNLATAYLETRQYEPAVEQLRMAVTLQPDYARAHNNLGWALLQLDRLDEAVTHLGLAASLSPDDATVHHNLAEVRLRHNDLAAAVPHLERAIALAPDSIASRVSLGHALTAMGRVEDALVHLRRAAELAPGDADVLTNLGNAELERANPVAAAEAYREALAVRPQHPLALNNLGLLRYRQGALDEAAAYLGQAVEAAPEYGNAHRNLGDVLVDRGEYSRGAAHYARALDLAPQDADAMCKLAWTLATAPEESVRDGARALELAQRAAAQVGRSPAVLRVLAAAYAEAGRPTEAIAGARQALELAQAATDRTWVELLERDLAEYRNGNALREWPKAPTPAL